MKIYKADSADIVGDVKLSENCSVFFNAVIRGDHHQIVIGENTNIQDCVVIHTGTKYQSLLVKMLLSDMEQLFMDARFQTML